MVATLVRLRLLVLRNTLRGQTARLVAVIIGAVYGVGITIGVVATLFVLSGSPASTIRTAVVIGGSVLLLGWVVLPLLLTGIDETLEPSRLAMYPIPLGQMMTGLLLSGFVGMTGAATAICALATGGSWLGSPGVAAVAVLCGALGAVTCVVASRAVTAFATGLSTGRRFREARGIVVLVPVFLLGPILAFSIQGLTGAGASLPGVADALAWTPFGAAWAVPSSIALGRPGLAVLEALVALATLGLLWVLWRWGLGNALVSPGRAASRVRGAGKLGWFGRLGDGPTGAVAARCLTYWFRDPRYLRSLIVIPLMPVLLWFYAEINHSDAWLLAIGPVTAFFLAQSIVSDLSYDSTAFTLHLAAGVRGSADRAGRVVAVTTFVLPISVAFAIASCGFAGRWDMVPVLLGLTLGTLGSGLGACSVSSAILIMPVPAPGDNPFRARPGADISRGFQVFVIWGVVGALCIPEIALLVVALITGSALVGWIALVVGAVLGVFFALLGIRLGGRLLDRRGPALLAQLRVAA